MKVVNQKEFEAYLESHRKLSNSSISKYARQSHNRILRDLGISFYEVESMDALHQLLNDVKQMESLMEKDPKRMYSSAVSNYIKFKAFKNEQQYLIEEATYIYSIESEIAADNNEINQSEGIKPQPPAPLKEHSSQIYQRDRSVAAEAIRSSQYLCQIDYNHFSFKSQTTNENYVEAHHIIPISTQALFNYSIDCVPNIASLCPVCHRQIHYGYKSDKRSLLEILWDKKQEDILKAGIHIKLKEVMEMY